MEPTLNETMTKWEIAEMVKKGRHVLVLRGVSGSGKSTLASFIHKALEGTPTIVSADAYFTSTAGEYRFNPTLLPNAHAACLRAFVRGLQRDPAWSPGDPEGPTNEVLIVDNTNTTVAECAPYMALAAAYGWTPTLVGIDADPRKAAARNVHGVSAETVDSQHTRMIWGTAALPTFWRRVALDQ